MNGSIQNLLKKIGLTDEQRSPSGFYSIKGGSNLMVLSTNDTKCQNPGDCKDSNNSGQCTNGLCEGSTNNPPSCTNSQVCII